MEYASLPNALKNQLSKLKTPFFLLMPDRAADNLAMLRRTFRPEQVYYAVKCNSLPPILAALAEKGCGFEVNNCAEMEKVLAAGVPVNRIINSSPVTSAADVRAMYAEGVRYFAFDTRNQAENLSLNAPECLACLRLRTGNEESVFKLSHRFGVPLKEAPSLLMYARDAGLNVSGLTFHVGSQCSFPDNWQAGLRECGKLFRQFPCLKTVNIGGGYPVPYNTIVPTISEIAQVIHETCDTYFASPPHTAGGARPVPRGKLRPDRRICDSSGRAISLVKSGR